MNDKIIQIINAVFSILGYSMLMMYGGWQITIAVFLIEITILLTIRRSDNAV